MLAAKKVLRTHMSQTLKNMSRETRSTQSNEIFRKLKENEYYTSSLKIGVYLSMEEEVNTYLIIQDIFASGKKCYIPWYDKNQMKMLQLKSLEALDDLILTKWNIKQHADPEFEEDALKSGGLDLVLIPGLAFSPSGHRLGRGKGYYDKFLTKLKELSENNQKNVTLMALAFKEQVVNSVPVGPHDVILDVVLHP